ncbi:hypothetical protein [Actinoplanes sp. NPDC048796]|uniref:hypothetical protein n=1 Tax=Actinoplanes sp. NPDC048796 TaxID=3155640 RepID=UPI0033D6F66B
MVLNTRLDLVEAGAVRRNLTVAVALVQRSGRLYMQVWYGKRLTTTPAEPRG